MRIEMPSEVEWVIKKIREHGFEAYVVGGCVRDTLLLRTPGDWDITTSARPEEIKAIFGKTVDTGLKHGTVTVIKNHKGYEITTYRIDGEYHDGRHPDSVEFTSSLREDLKRRDFTVNAMAYSHETGLVDAFGGLADLQAGVIRCVGCPHDRFSEDALRLLRAVRFAAQLNFRIEENTYQAIADLAPGLMAVSRERVQTELTKTLLSANPEKIVMVEERGMSPFVTSCFTEAFHTGGCDAPGNGESFGHCFLELSRLSPEKALRWAGFLRFLPAKEATGILKELKLDNETIANAGAMVAASREMLIPEKPVIRRFLSRMTPYQFGGCLDIKALNGCSGLEEIRRLWREIADDGDCLSLKELAVDGSVLMQMGMKPGREIGQTLNRLLELVLTDPSLNEKQRLLVCLKKDEGRLM